MNANELVLNIAVNMGRVARWANEGKTSRVPAFLEETTSYLKQLETADKNPRFHQTFNLFKTNFQRLKDSEPNQDWAEEALTWANILSHRAKLA